MRAPAEWGVTASTLLAETPTSRVHRVVLADGRSAVIKDLKPIGVSDELRGADFLAWRDGDGAVRLLARHDSTLLLEDAGDEPLVQLLEREGDVSATSVLVHVLGRLHSPASEPPPSALLRLEERFTSLFTRADRGDQPYTEAAGVARRLLADQRGVRPLHGDLHHTNVHRSVRGWLAIDPKGLIGDAAYEVANAFSNPLGRDDLRTDPGRARRLAASFAAHLGREPATVLSWAFAHACLSAAWHVEDGEPAEADRTLRVAAAIRSLL